MKTATTFRYSNFPLKVVNGQKPTPERPRMRVVEKNDFRNMRFAFIENIAINDSTNWDASWFASYE